MSTQARIPDADEMRRILQETGIPPAEGHRIVARVAEHFGAGSQEMLDGGNQARYVLARAVAAYLIREKLHWSLPRIGLLFGKHHVTALRGIRKIAASRLVSPELDAILREFEAEGGTQ